MNAPTNKDAAAPSRLGVWLHHHGHSVVFSLGRAWRKPWATLLTIMVMALALALPLGLSIALDNLTHFAGSVQQSRDINLFLKTDTDAAAAGQVADSLRGRADVANVTVQTPEQGLQELRDGAGLGEAIDALHDNPLPTLLIVTPKAGADDARLAQSLEGLPQADLVQHDALWRKRLDAWLGFARGWYRCCRCCWAWAPHWWWAIPCAWTSRRAARKSACCSCWAPATASSAARSCTWARGTGWGPARWRWR